jgi:hypothetical protein
MSLGPSTRDLLTSATELPRTLRGFRGYHAGETFLVCGCGSSLAQIIAPERFVSIGVNDVGRLFHPDYLLVLNPRQQFSGDRFRYVESNRARAVFTQLDLGISHPHVVPIRLGQRAGTDWSDPDVLPYTRNSPYPALCLAVHMGARRIGLIGVDFTDNHFFGATGKHPLLGDLGRIEGEYRELQAACQRRGVEVFNLSAESRLSAFPKQRQEEFVAESLALASERGRKVFFVNYKFLSCGDVFSDGLAHAADEMGAKWESVLWDDPQLERIVAEFQPDLLFVVHGRRFSGRWKHLLPRYRSAVWLLDEPYEVDDTQTFSSLFQHVFVNDPSTLQRHANTQYLPVCYDPRAHSYLAGDARPERVGFIGGHNLQREQALARLARKGLLSYVVGGPWRDPAVNRLCRAGNIPAAETSALYRSTRIVINLFRTQHHYNRAGIPAFSLNPRVYEGLGCGALVISEYRSELKTLCPELPTFRTMDEMEQLVERYLSDEQLFVQTRRACIRRLAGHTYASRLATVLTTCLPTKETPMEKMVEAKQPETHNAVAVAAAPPLPLRPLPPELIEAWELDADCIQVEPDGSFLLHKAPDHTPGAERGIAGKAYLRDVTLAFDLYLQDDCTFIAKIHQAEANNHLRDSYHVMCRGGKAYLARQNHIFCHLMLPLKTWFRFSFSYHDGIISVGRNGAVLAQLKERFLESGHSFVGVKAGSARVRNIGGEAPQPATRNPALEYEILRSEGTTGEPVVSIVTTVYDRVQCLERCLRSVRGLKFRDFEHIIVADAPPAPVLAQIENVIKNATVTNRRILATLKQRRNDWGISPAAAGLSLARGKYVCFLSDDNGYIPSHFDGLVETLEQDANLGFVYSSCLYAGRAVLRTAAPRPAAIDLGQPLFRRELFARYLGGTIPFHEFGWDWKMIESFLKRGVRWRHLDDATFVFRLSNYPQLIANPYLEKSA